MAHLIRPAAAADLAAINDIYNHYVRETAITFDIEPWTMERRRRWFDQFGASGRHRLLVAERDGAVAGFAGHAPVPHEGGLRHDRRNDDLLRPRRHRRRPRTRALQRPARRACPRGRP